MIISFIISYDNSAKIVPLYPSVSIKNNIDVNIIEYMLRYFQNTKCVR